ncbi:hypothetical protein AGMMS50256_03940 [Betaproteobacteria bacterium]|nr:hypothetical protein AGMMS50256_03940 [Betaproteobacteria bacterium]
MKLGIALPLSLSCLLLLGGCATSRSVLDIPPPASKAVSASAGKEVLVTSVSDRRRFEANPSSPSIPSLDPGENQSADIKARAVGRKRNTFGKALGDILLKEGQTVETLTATSIRQAFAEKGYKLIDRKEQATKNTVFVEAAVDKFWSWLNISFSALTLNTEIASELSLKSAEKTTTTTVSVKASDNYQTGMEENWIEVINKALRAYVDELKTKLE